MLDDMLQGLWWQERRVLLVCRCERARGENGGGVNSGLRKPAWIGVTSRPQQPPAPTTTTTTTLPSSLHHLASRPLLLYRRATSAFRYFSTLILTLDSLPEPPPRWKQPWSCSSLASPHSKARTAQLMAIYSVDNSESSRNGDYTCVVIYFLARLASLN